MSVKVLGIWREILKLLKLNSFTICLLPITTEIIREWLELFCVGISGISSNLLGCLKDKIHCKVLFS